MPSNPGSLRSRQAVAPPREPRLAPPAAIGPAAVISRRAADRLRAGHLWVYRTDVEELIPALTNASQTTASAESTHPIAPGALVTLLDSRRVPLGSAVYSSASQIALRKVSTEAALTREQYLLQIRARVHAALDLREALAPSSAANNACRLLFSEADDLPGVVADRYNDLIVLQLLTQGTARPDVRTAVVDTLVERLASRPETPLRSIVERPDPRVRELEQLPPTATEALFQSGSEDDGSSTQFTLNGLRFHFDAGAGQKTGAFLDQRLNYAAAARHARGKALDICTYQGGFALHLAQACTHVTGVDASRAALEVAERNLLLNTALTASVAWIEADAFELLREYEATGHRYDSIVLDPPAFAKSKRAAEGAMRGYKELNLRALKMLNPGGTLVTCSCSHHVNLADFTAIVTDAAADAGRRVQLLETLGAAPDHPAILTLPESSYLKCLIARVAS